MFRISTAHERPLVTGDGKLVSLNCAGSRPCAFRHAQREVARRNHFDEVHKVEAPLRSHLCHAIEWVRLMGNTTRELRAKGQRVDRVGEGVFLCRPKVLVQVVHVHLCTREGLSRRDVEVSDDLVDAQVPRDIAPFLAHRVETLSVVFSLTLLDALAFAERPADGGVRFANILARIATALGLFGSWRAVAFSAVAGVEVFGSVFVKIEGGSRNGLRFWIGGETGQVDSVSDGRLLFTRDIHHVESKELAWHVREGYV